MSNKPTPWDESHLCRRYSQGAENNCKYFLQTGSEETVLNGKKLDKCCYYCTSENKVRKIGSGGTWTGLSPKFCPKRESAEQAVTANQPSYLDKLRERFPKVTTKEEWFTYCPAELFDGDGIAVVGDCPTVQICEDCWKLTCPADVSFCDDLKDFEDEYFEHYPPEEDAVPDEEPAADEPAENQVVPQNVEAVPAAFDYSELDGDTADKLQEVAQKIVHAKQRYIFEVAEQVKIAHDLLANHKNGMFGQWCEYVGFSRDTGNNLIHIAELFGNISSEQRDNLSKLTDGNIKLLYEAARPSAPAELVEAVKSGDITTHKDYIKLKKELEEQTKRADAAEQRADFSHRNYLAQSKIATKFAGENSKLEEQVKELESRPVDVAVQRDESALAEIDRLKDELAKAQQELIDASFSSGGTSADMISEFYEELHGNALSAIRSCADFAEKNGGQIKKRFRSLADVVNDYINELEEF